MTNRKQRVVLNGQCSSWVDIQAGVLQGSILGPILFLIHVDDLPNGLKSKCKLFADGTSLFSLVHNICTSGTLVLKFRALSQICIKQSQEDNRPTS